MAIFNFFKSKTLSESKIAKLVKTATDPYVASEDRDDALERLAESGSDAAIRGMLQRFTMNATGHIADETEKKWVEDRLVSIGESALPELRRYIDAGRRLTYALRAFQRIAGRDRTVAMCLEVLERLGPEDHRNSDGKAQLVQHIAEEITEDSLNRLLPFLADHSDDIRWLVLSVLEACKPETVTPAQRISIAEALAQALSDSQTGPRIHLRTAEVAAHGEWQMPGTLQALSADVEGAFYLDKKHYVRRSTASNSSLRG